MRVSGVDVKVEFWRFRPCPFLGSNGSPHCKDLQTMVSHAHWERKLDALLVAILAMPHSTRHRGKSAAGLAASVNDLGPADRNSLDRGRCG